MFIWSKQFPCPKELTGYHADKALKGMGVVRFKNTILERPEITWRKEKL
jgi:hypothetical protein